MARIGWVLVWRKTRQVNHQYIIRDLRDSLLKVFDYDAAECADDRDSPEQGGILRNYGVKI